MTAVQEQHADETLRFEKLALRFALQTILSQWGRPDLWVSDHNWSIGEPEDTCGWVNLCQIARDALELTE
jgi:hypothetical protein